MNSEQWQTIRDIIVPYMTDWGWELDPYEPANKLADAICEALQKETE